MVKPRFGSWAASVRPLLGGVLASVCAAATAMTACGGTEKGASPCVSVCDCVASAFTADDRQPCLEQCNASVQESPADPVTRCVTDLDAAGYGQCQSSCVAFAPPARSLGDCLGFRKTDGCTSDGLRQPSEDQSCFAIIASGVSGYCECADGRVPINCGHLEGDCENACATSRFGTLLGAGGAGGGGAGGATGTGGSGGSSSGGTGAGGVASDPCAQSWAPTGYGYICGSNLGLSGTEATTLYLCNGTTTYGTAVCPQGCSAGPVGNPNYCYGSDPCVNAPADGQYCGGNLATPSASPSTYYSCANHVTVATIYCTYGCTAAAPGVGDVCVQQ